MPEFELSDIHNVLQTGSDDETESFLHSAKDVRQVALDLPSASDSAREDQDGFLRTPSRRFHRGKSTWQLPPHRRQLLSSVITGLISCWICVAVLVWIYVVCSRSHPFRALPSLVSRSAAAEPLPKPGSTAPSGITWSATSQQSSADYVSKVREELRFCFQSYRDNAWGHDVIDPTSGAGDDWIGLGVLLLDSLDTLYIAGLTSEFQQAVDWVASELLPEDGGRVVSDGGNSTTRSSKGKGWNAAHQKQASYFETSIRALGGLLGGFSVSGEEVLLKKAVALGNILSLHAFPYEGQTLPLRAVGVKFEVANKMRESGAGGQIKTNIAEAGSEQLEFRYLAFHDSPSADLAKYPNKAFDAVVHSAARKGYSGLVPSCVYQTRSGKVNFCAGGFSMGGASDSYYEYLLKLFVQNPSASTEQYLSTWVLAMREMQRRLVQTTADGHVFLARRDYLDDSTPDYVMEHLDCFAPGMLMLGAKTLSELKEGAREAPGAGVGRSVSVEEIRDYENLAKDLTKTCYDMYRMAPSGLAPERVRFSITKSDGQNSNSLIPDMHFLSGFTWNILRPELIESLFYMHFYTKDEQYVRWGETIFDDFVKHTKTYYGFTPVNGVDTANPTPTGAAMESFFLAETLKYFYLLFAGGVNLTEFVFTTEAHPLRIFS